ARRSQPRRDDDAAGGLVLPAAVDFNRVPGRGVTPRADEKVVHAVEDLPRVQIRLRHRDPADTPHFEEHVRHHRLELLRRERQQDPLPSRRIGIDADHPLIVEILEHVGDQAVLAEDDDEIRFAEDEVGNEGPVHDMNAPEPREDALGLLHRALVRPVFPLVIVEVRSQVLNIEPRLGLRVETGDELVQTGMADDQDDLVFGQAVHRPYLSRESNSRSRSGDMLSWPIFPAFSARSWKARAIIWPGSMPALVSAWRILGLVCDTAFIRASMAYALVSASSRALAVERATSSLFFSSSAILAAISASPSSRCFCWMDFSASICVSRIWRFLFSTAISVLSSFSLIPRS